MPLVTAGEPGHRDYKPDDVYFFMPDHQQRRIHCAVRLEVLENFDHQIDRRFDIVKCPTSRYVVGTPAPHADDG
jgi:hypothetical protein